MGSHKIELSVYADVGLEVEGLRKQVSIDDDWSSTDETVIPYKELVDKEIAYNLIGSDTMSEKDYFKLMAVSEALCEASAYMRKKLYPLKLEE